MSKRKRPFGRWFNLPSRRLYGCDNAGNPIIPTPTAKCETGHFHDSKGNVVEVGEMEPEIQKELDRIWKEDVVTENR